ncbi:methyltransferase [Clostridium sp. MCC353]|uniref:methyltransferase n=1 Tax=Clostridium sp. MCC353 TaxID=2592646 RepID=UPI001C030A04|nr:methyltransferase [Clostridium sp. MCC353]MBT9779164.1 methyltransferase [Clostridium sp. MCC353]
MIKEIWDQIVNNQDTRQNLSRLRQELKGARGREQAVSCMAGAEERLIGLLQDEDAKVRKNAALLMGELGKKEYLEPLFQAYRAEQQMFVKSSYLIAIKNFDYRNYLEYFKGRLNELSEVEAPPENLKHITEEIRQLSSMILTIEGVKSHVFTGSEDVYDIILLTNRNFPEVTMKELLDLEPEAKAKIFNAGIMARVTGLDWMDKIRTYQDLLFVVKGMRTCPMDAGQAAEIIVKSQLLDFLARNHNGGLPFYFRVELKSRMELDKRSAFAKKLSSQIERLSDRKLINTTSNYEFEIRLIENKEGGFNILLKLYTLKDRRFSYRKEVVPTSIKAVNAALAVKLTEKYRKEDAQVLDPFCGVGTMLIERHKAVKANTMYGVDIQEEAILKSRKNTEAAGQIIHYINRDFFEFKHEYLFDEIITDLPFSIGRKTEEEIKSLYQSFFASAGHFLKPDGIMVLYSRNGEYVRKMSVENGFAVVDVFEISLKEGSYVFVLKRK